MTTKKSKSAPELPSEDDSIDRSVEAIMGPAPEVAPPAITKSSLKPAAVKKHSSVSSAAEEANAALKSMDPGLGGQTIEKIDDDVALPQIIPANVPKESIYPVPSEDPTVAALKPAKSAPEDEPEEEPEESAEDLSEAEEPGGDETVSAEESEVVDEAEVHDEPEDDGEDDAEDPVLDDAVTAKAVDDIVAAEGDAVLAAEDAKLSGDKDEDEVPFTPIKKREKAHNWLKTIWATSLGRWLIIGGSVALLLALTLIPYSRYFILNTAGVRSSINLTVLDQGTDQPLKNVQVSAAGVSGQTDSKGRISLPKVRLGRTKLLIEKRAFAKESRDITVGWGSNPLGTFSVKAMGTQYDFMVTDFLSGKPIAGAEASSGDGNAHADKDGKIILTLDTSSKSDTDQITVEITAGSYRKETINLTVNNKENQAVKMVPSRKHVFISKRSGKFDVYTVDVDGKNETKIVSGTGLERDDIVLVPHQNENIAALVATRENVRDSSGYLLSTLYTIDTESGDLVKIDQSEQIQVVGWSKDEHLIYVKIAAGSSGANPKRHRLMSFNAKNVADVKELASSNAFNDVLMVGDSVYYAPSNTFQDNPNAGLYVVNPDATNQKNLLSKEVFNIFRTGYDELLLSTGPDWFSYKVGNVAAVSAQNPSNPASRLYTDNASNDTSLWVDQRDGKGVLLAYDKSTKKDTTLVTKAGLKAPMYWLGADYVIFRINDGKDIADFVINTKGGEARKILDVTDTSGIDRWYYY